ncbi:response regulator [Flavobacterium sp.]|jgi:two-component system response regulator NreC|uniref:response regulator n=1 Tax=Flavobacterium sp. TaxID=239 RepID=UPI0037BE4D4A
MHFQLLFIDDHAVVIEGYKSILSFNCDNHTFESHSVYSAQEAYQHLTDATNNTIYQFVFVDYTLPECEELKLFSGEDLIPIIRKHQPQSKIVIITSHTEHFLLFSLYKNHAPDGILIKSDFTANEFLKSFEVISKNETYYSQTMLEALKRIKALDFYLDLLDMKIILLLNQGIKTKNLNDHLPLTTSAIDKRKLKIKQFLGIEKGNDEDIIREAKKRRFI